MTKSEKKVSWLSDENERAEKLLESGQNTNNPSAAKKPNKKLLPKGVNRSVKSISCRKDYQQLFDELVAREKHISGKKGPDLLEEALGMLFTKYNKKT